MNKYLAALKNENTQSDEPTKPTEVPEKFHDAIREEPTKPTEGAFVGFVGNQHKESENFQSDPEESWWDVPGDASPAPRNVFDPACRLPDGVIFATECDAHHGCFIAYRIGTKSPVGHGASQVEAVLNLADLEATIDRDH